MIDRLRNYPMGMNGLSWMPTPDLSLSSSLSLSQHSPSPLEISLGKSMVSSRSLPPCAMDSGCTAFSFDSASLSSGKLVFRNSPGLSAEGCPGSHSCRSVDLPSSRAKISSMFSHLRHQILCSTTQEESSQSSAKFGNIQMEYTVECFNQKRRKMYWGWENKGFLVVPRMSAQDWFHCMNHQLTCANVLYCS